ncbi:hypothetical protein CVT24_011843 [Panaeolus cyanescens]|uniref:Cytochrome P450 n=1 Tax=Panaeolus cyanescens TaxID=181874 RepID=A0A409YNT3_9AGAR|nr:hypothetical protein CVT24_011843 [Panaeolus cyanescens]
MDTAFQFTDYGEKWREHRKIFHQEMNAIGAQRLRPHQSQASQRFLKRLLVNSDSGGASVVEQVREYVLIAGEISVSITYGFQQVSRTQHDAHLSQNAIDPLVQLLSTGGTFLVDVIPILRYLPSWATGASFKRKAKLWNNLRQQMFDATFGEVKTDRSSGIAAPSFTSFCLNNIDPSKDIPKQEEDINHVAGSIYAAAGETVIAVLSTCIHILLNHPEAVKRAQKEMNEVLGFGILPTFDDERVLPFTKSLILEMQRWKSPTPLGLPHVSTDDLTYKEYRIPKGSIVLGNSFVCPGRFVAEASIWVILSSLIAAFNFRRVDETGGPSHSFQTGLLRIPNEFKVRFEPRSEAMRSLISELHEG